VALDLEHRKTIGRLQSNFENSQDIFCSLLICQADYMVRSTKMLLAYLEKPGKKRRKKARRLEKEADDVRRRLVEALNPDYLRFT
jgi:hypothetical protein